MGCDIHIYPEYWIKKELENDSDTIYAHSICADYNIGRNYDIFSIMAGVRGSVMDMIVAPRGLPEGNVDEPPIGFEAEHALTLTVIPDHELTGKERSGWGERTVAQSVVNSWSTGGLFRGPAKVYKTFELHDKTKREVILNPDFHSISWLTLPELLEVRKRYITSEIEYNYAQYELKKKDTKEYRKILKEVKNPEMLLKHNFGLFECTSLNGLIGMLYFIEKSQPDIKSRIVFWFDS